MFMTIKGYKYNKKLLLLLDFYSIFSHQENLFLDIFRTYVQSEHIENC